jgi:hypothetical protein
MTDSTTPRTRMTHGYRRRIGVSGSPIPPGIGFALLPPPGSVPCAPAHTRPRNQSSDYGRLRPNRSCAATHSSATIAEPSDSSPQSTVAATISANFRTLPLP